MIQIHSEIKKFQFEYPFETAHGLKTEQPALLVSLKFSQWTGYGETTSISYYHQDVNVMQELLDIEKRNIMRYAYNGPERFWHFLHHLLPNQNFLIAALDIASWDMFARMKQVALHQVLGMQWKNIKPTCYTIGIQNMDRIEEIIDAKRFPIYKLKVNSESDLAIVEQVYNKTMAEIWIDANASWQPTDARFLLNALKSMNVTMIEQPFQAEFDEYVVKCKEINRDIDFIADESCKEVADLNSVLKYYDGANIKLSKCGGITPALQMMQILKKEQKKIMIGSMCESQGGANALAHFIPIVDFVDIDGPLLLNNNTSLQYDNGLISVANVLGSGYLPVK